MSFFNKRKSSCRVFKYIFEQINAIFLLKKLGYNQICKQIFSIFFKFQMGLKKFLIKNHIN